MPEENILSTRETEILALVATGLTNREIAQKLTISPNTVKVHLSNIFEKLGVSSRTEATLVGMEHGIVDVPGAEPPTQSFQTTWRDIAQKYLWVWIPAVLLLAVFLVTFSSNILFPPAETPNPADFPERWQKLASLPEARAGMAAASYDGNIYAIAGEGPQGVSGSVFRYLPETDLWERLSNKPTPVVDVGAALIGEKLYVPGGRLADGQPTNSLEIYDPRQDSWETGAPLPKAISAYALTGFEGQIYLFGGWDGMRAVDDVFAYDPATDTWQEQTPMAIARQDAGAVALADKIVVLGGRNETGALKEAQTYFPSRDTNGENPWAEFMDLPESRYGFGVASISDVIFVIGGMPEIVESDGAEIAYQFVSNAWQPLTIELNEFLTQPVLIPMGSQIYALFSKAKTTSTWRYQAQYYEVFIPIVP
jgi:DNA-binding CsgD family transcriptional regulator